MSENPAKKSFFSRPFKLFLFIVLPLVAVAGILTWAAQSAFGPEECRRTDKRGAGLLICNRLHPLKVSKDKSKPSQKKHIIDIDVPEADPNLGTDHDSTISGLDIQVTNHTDKDYFVPFRTQKELASFAQWATTEGQGKDKVSICVKNKAVIDTTTIADGGYSADVVGCGVEGRTCTVTELRGQRCVAKANVDDWGIITQKPSASARL